MQSRDQPSSTQVHVVFNRLLDFATARRENRYPPAWVDREGPAYGPFDRVACDGTSLLGTWGDTTVPIADVEQDERFYGLTWRLANDERYQCWTVRPGPPPRDP